MLLNRDDFPSVVKKELKLRIDIFSDPVCPWCYIGKRRLEVALGSYHSPIEDVEVTWRTFQLNPNMPPEGIDRTTYLEDKFGGPERASQVYGNIRDVGKSVGLEFNFEAIQRTPNTIKAHRLVRLAHESNVQNSFVEQLFHAYFIDGQNIGDDKILIAIASSAGMDGKLVRSILSGTRFKDDVTAEDKEARSMGLSGVPCFILDGKYVLSGAQEPSTLHHVFDVIQQENQ
jgi:predicted DsbA family dithiol-disulfide isomerase